MTRNVGARMLAEALERMQQAERMQRQFFGLRPAHLSGPCWEPPVDIFETENEISVFVALPGVVPEKVDVMIDGNSVYVVGERLMPASPAALIHRLEIPYGRFERRVDLPTDGFEVACKELAHGCLLLLLRKC